LDIVINHDFCNKINFEVLKTKKMKLSGQDLAIIMVVIIVVLVLFAKSQSRKEEKSETVFVGNGNDIVNLVGGGVYSDLDLSGNPNLKATNFSTVLVRSITFPKYTVDPVLIVFVDVAIEKPWNTVPDKVMAFAAIGVRYVDWIAILPTVLASPYLYGFAMYQVPGPDGIAPNSNPLMSIGDIIVGKDETFTLFNNFDLRIMLGEVDNISSVGDVWMHPRFGYQGANPKILFFSCANLVTIGDISAALTDPDGKVDLQIEGNPILTSVGDIEVGRADLFFVQNNPALTIVGRITLGSNNVNPNMQFANNYFVASMISQILVDVDSSGVPIGTLNFAGNPGNTFGSFTAQGQAAYLSLQTKGWTLS